MHCKQLLFSAFKYLECARRTEKLLAVSLWRVVNVFLLLIFRASFEILKSVFVQQSSIYRKFVSGSCHQKGDRFMGKRANTFRDDSYQDKRRRELSRSRRNACRNERARRRSKENRERYYKVS